MGFVIVIAIVLGIVAYAVTGLSIVQIIIFTGIGIISCWFPFAIAKSMEVTDKDIEDAFKDFPKKIIVNIKHESEDDNDTKQHHSLP